MSFNEPHQNFIASESKLDFERRGCFDRVVSIVSIASTVTELYVNMQFFIEGSDTTLPKGKNLDEFEHGQRLKRLDSTCVNNNIWALRPYMRLTTGSILKLNLILDENAFNSSASLSEVTKDHYIQIIQSRRNKDAFILMT